MCPGGQPNLPIAETSVPAMIEIERHARRHDAADADLAWEEDSLTRWRAVALFGGLIAAEGLLYSRFGIIYIAVAALALLVGALIVPAVGREYGWALVVASLLALAVGLLPLVAGSFFTVVSAPVPLGPTLAGEGTVLVGAVLTAGGITALAFGLAGSIRISRRLDA